MFQVIRSSDRYHIENEWLSSYWHFSFDHYYDPANVSFGPLRVFNEDVIAPANGFPLHAHREMEIVTYLIDGEIEHQDTAGHHGIISAGEVQRMSAGTGIRHSEGNPSRKTPAHLLQLWLQPAVPRLAPSWEQKRFPLADRAGKLLPIAVPASNGTGHGKRPEHAVEIHQDATIYTSLLGAGLGAGPGAGLGAGQTVTLHTRLEAARLCFCGGRRAASERANARAGRPGAYFGGRVARVCGTEG